MHSEVKKTGGAIIRAGAIIGTNTVCGIHVTFFRIPSLHNVDQMLGSG